MEQNIEKELREHPFPSVAVRAFANALSFFLVEDNEGIICQGENEDGIMQLFAIWKSGSQLLIYPIKNPDMGMKPGCTITMHENEEDSITAAILSESISIQI